MWLILTACQCVLCYFIPRRKETSSLLHLYSYFLCRVFFIYTVMAYLFATSPPLFSFLHFFPFIFSFPLSFSLSFISFLLSFLSPLFSFLHFFPFSLPFLFPFIFSLSLFLFPFIFFSLPFFFLLFFLSLSLFLLFSLLLSYSEKWNVNSLVQNLSPGCWTHFLRC